MFSLHDNNKCFIANEVSHNELKNHMLITNANNWIDNYHDDHLQTNEEEKTDKKDKVNYIAMTKLRNTVTPSTSKFVSGGTRWAVIVPCVVIGGIVYPHC